MPPAALRIAQVSPTFPPYLAGTGVVSYEIARGLAQRGHAITVLTPSMKGIPRQEELAGVSVRRLRSALQLGHASVMPSLFPNLRVFDLVHLHYPYIGGAELAAAACIVFKIPLVVTIHNDLVPPGGWRNAGFAVAEHSGRLLALRVARRLIFVSHGQAETSRVGRRLEGDPRIRVVPNGVDVAAFKSADRAGSRKVLALGPDGPTLCFVAALDSAHEYKGLEILFEAMTLLVDLDPSVLVVGEGNLRSAYEAKAASYGLGHRARFLGRLGRDDLALAYSSSDLVVVPSTAPESFSLVAAEAQACGVPVVAADSPGIRSAVRHGVTGLLVSSARADAIAAGIRELLTDPGRRRLMSEEGQRWLRAEFGWTERVSEHLEIYRQALEDSRSSRPTGRESAKRW